MTKSQDTISVDVIVLGAGIVGLTFAALLLKHTDLNIALVDQASLDELKRVPKSRETQRVSAVNQLSIKLWLDLGLWPMIAKQAEAYQHMQVWDYFGGQLDFSADTVANPLGYIIPNHVVQQALLDYVLSVSSTDPARIQFCLNHQCNTIQHNHHDKQVIVDEHIIGNYLIAADGPNSWVRNYLAVPLRQWSYGHSAIIAQVETAQPHLHTAWQKFTEAGPLAMLPLPNEQQCALVWSVDEATKTALMDKTNEAFKIELNHAFDHHLGEIISTSERVVYPLSMRHVRQYIHQQHIIFIGDAAHTVHPLAGQGLNIALQDVLALADVFVTGVSIKKLRQFERARKTEVWQMIAGLEVIKRAFATQVPLLQSLVHWGVKQVNQQEFLKQYVMTIATGDKTTVPSWLVD